MPSETSQHHPQSPWRIGIDLIGSDTPIEVYIQGIGQGLQQARQSNSEVPLHIVAYGSHWTQQQQQLLSEAADQLNPQQFTFVKVSHAIGMDCSPIQAIKLLPNSSLHTALQDLKEDRIDALITCGNSGALVASVGRYLEFFPHIPRPAFISQLMLSSNLEDPSLMLLDSGANYSANAHYLASFAAMGVSYWHWLQKISPCASTKEKTTPLLGLLNIGVESYKGPSSIQEAYQLLQTASQDLFRFVGNIEPDIILHQSQYASYRQPIDILVTDGFTGNIFLKTLEAASILFSPKDRKLSLERQKQSAILYGINRPIIKCHGSSSAKAICSAIVYLQSLLLAGLASHLRQQSLQSLGIKF
jgi:glycerol-3-phosphate acyltransferase PlsX